MVIIQQSQKYPGSAKTKDQEKETEIRSSDSNICDLNTNTKAFGKIVSGS